LRQLCSRGLSPEQINVAFNALLVSRLLYALAAWGAYLTNADWQDIWFLPARRYASAGLCDSDVSVCPSVRPSVCLSVRRAPVLCLAERKQDREMYTV